MIILRELLAFVIETPKRMVGFWWEFNPTCHHAIAPLLWFLGPILLHFFNQVCVCVFLPGLFCYNSKMTTRISNGSFFFMLKLHLPLEWFSNYIIFSPLNQSFITIDTQHIKNGSRVFLERILSSSNWWVESQDGKSSFVPLAKVVASICIRVLYTDYY